MNIDIDRALQVLERTPGTLRAMLAGLSEPLLRGTEGSSTFSAFDNLGHLIDGEETDWIPRARIILARGPSTRFTPYDRFRHYTRNAGRSLDSLLDEFAVLREVNVQLLRSWDLGDAELDLLGEHPGLGPVTLRQLLAAYAVHDLGHIAQIARVVAKQYLNDVGPWVAYLPVLTDHQVPRS